VSRNILPPPLDVIPQPGHDLQRVLELNGRVEAPIQNPVVHRLGMPRNVADQRHDGSLELREDALQLVGRQPRLSAIEQRIVRALLVAQRVGDPPVQLDILLEVWREELEVRILARLLPHRPCRRPGASNFRHQLRRQLARVIVVAACDPNQACLIGIERKANDLTLELVKQPADIIGGESDVGQAAQGR
jgi:hypothetical protein